MAKDITSQVVGISIAVLMVAFLMWTGLGILFNANDYSSVTSEEFTTTVWGAAVNLAEINLVASSETVYNATTTIPASGNYTIDTTAGTITPSVNSTLVNASTYSIDYDHGTVDSTASTLGKLVVAIVLIIAVMILFLRAVGFKVT